MLDLKLIREQTDEVKQGLKKKGVNLKDIDALLALDSERRTLLQEVEALKAKRNRANDEISAAKKAGKPAEALINDMKTISQKIAEIDSKVGEIDNKIAILTVNIPNIPDKSVPEGVGNKANKTVREWGKAPKFAFKPKDHIELGAKLGWLSFDRA